MVFGLVPCLSTISWLGRGPLRKALAHAYEDSIDDAYSKADHVGLACALTSAPKQAGSCWRDLPSLTGHLGRCLDLLISETSAQKCAGSSFSAKELIHCERHNGKLAAGDDADIWSAELGGCHWPALQAVEIPVRLSKISPAEDLTFNTQSIKKLGPLVGSGTYGQVFEAEVEGIGRAAIKLLDETMLKEEGNLEESYADFLMEADLHRQCRHQNVVRCYGLASLPALKRIGRSGQQAMVMELLPSDSTLTNLLRSRGGLPRHKLLSCALDIARALEHIHRLGIIHFDVKSQNVMVDSWGVCKLTDFGLAFEAQGQPLDFFGRGSVAYMAPEIHDRARLVDNKVDVFSFGIFMWEIMTGMEPHHDLAYDEIVEGVLHRSLRPPLDGVPSGLPALVNLMQECWRETPYSRPSFSTIVRTLESPL